MGIPRSLREPLIGAEQSATLRCAARLLDECWLGAITVESDQGLLLGAVDAPTLTRALREAGFDPARRLRDVELAPLATLPEDSDVRQAIERLQTEGARHGVIEADGRRWMVRLDALMRRRIEQLEYENECLEAYVCADAIGGD